MKFLIYSLLTIALFAGCKKAIAAAPQTPPPAPQSHAETLAPAAQPPALPEYKTTPPRPVPPSPRPVPIRPSEARPVPAPPAPGVPPARPANAPAAPALPPGPIQPEPPGSLIVEVTGDEAFNREVILSKEPVIVEFYSPSCGFCKKAEPTIHEIAKEYEGRVKVVKVNSRKNYQLGQQYEVTGTPGFYLFKDGNVAYKLIGAKKKEFILKKFGFLPDDTPAKPAAGTPPMPPAAATAK